MIQAQMLQQLQSAVQAGQLPAALASVPPTPSLFIQLHHLVQLQQVLQRLQLQQASAYATHQQARLPCLPTARPDALAVKIAKVRQQIVALHMQIKQSCRHQQLLNAAAASVGGGPATVAQETAAFDAPHDLVRDFSSAMMMRDDAAAAWKSTAAPESVRAATDLSHSMTQSLDTWPGWLATADPRTPGSEVFDASGTSAALDIEEFIPGKPWQGPVIRSAEDDPFITPGGASSSVMTPDERGRSLSQHSVSSNNDGGWPTSADSVDHSSAKTARAPPGLVPSSSVWQQPAFSRSTSWTPQSSYGKRPAVFFCFL